MGGVQLPLQGSKGISHCSHFISRLAKTCLQIQKSLRKGLLQILVKGEPCERGILVKGMGTRGGSRHRSTPYIESGLLVKVLLRHEDILVNFKEYESCSRNSGADPKRLIHCLDLVNHLLDLEASAEIHPAPMRQSMLHILTQLPKW